MAEPTRLIVPIDTDDAASWSHAISYAKAVGTAAEPPARTYVLLTHTKGQLKHTSLARHMGERAAKELGANRPVGLGDGLQLTHATLQTLSHASGAVVIAFYADDRMLERLDGTAGLVGVVAVPDLPGQIEDWTARWNPLVHGQQRGAPAALIADPVVENALTSLSKWINLSHAVMNPRDKGHLDEVLRILRAKGHSFDPAKMKSWAIRNGWLPGAADELATLANRIGALRSKPSLAGYHNPEERYDSWKS